MDDLIKNTGTNRPSLHFLPYGDMIPIERPSQNQKKETFSIIHCGVVPCNLQLKTLSQTILGLVPPVVEQGIQFHIINPDDPDNSLNKEFEKGISQDCRQYFRYLSPLYNHQFTRLLSSYSAGWMVFSFNEKRRTAPRYLNTFSSRLLSYLSAGLPVFISPEFEFMADLCREYGVGIILKSSDVMDLSAIIDDTDWDTLNRNVLAVRRLFSIEKQLPRFDQFITAFLN